MARYVPRIKLVSVLSLCVLLSLGQMPLDAQTMGSETPLTLGEAVKFGLANNPRITAARSQVNASQARVSQARSAFFPRVDISESFNRTTNPMWAFGTKLNQEVISQADFDSAKLNDPDPINNFTTTLSVTLPLYDRGQIRGGFTQAKLDHKAISRLEDRILQQVIVDILVSYMGVLLAQEQLKVVNDTLDTARAHYEINSEDFSKTANNYTLGAVMRFNLFSGFGLQSKVHEAMAKLRQTKAMARQLELGIRVETRQAFFMAQSAYQRIGVAQAAVAQAEEGLRIVRNRYESGLFTIVNLLDAEVALQQARTNHFRSLHDFEVATARLNLAAGIIDEDFQ